MTKSSFHKLLLGSVLMLLPFTVQAQVVLKNWTIEDHSGKVKSLYQAIRWKLPHPTVLHFGTTNALPVIMKSAIA